jgi:hypothetical protein
VSRLDLVGLDTSEVTALMESTAGHDLDQPGTDLALALQRETEGNPFFVGEAAGLLALGEHGPDRVDPTARPLAIPHRVREVIRRRHRSPSGM